MAKIKTFLYSFRNSLLKPAYYKDILKAKFSFSFKYFLLLFTFISLVTAALISVFLVKTVQPILIKAKTEVFNIYPESLVVTIKNGNLSTNAQEPFFVPLKSEWLPKDIADNVFYPPVTNILVIDTNAQPSDINKYQTFVLITKNAVSYYAGRNEIRIQTLQDLKSLTIDRPTVDQLLNQVIPYLGWVLPIIIFCIFIFLPLFAIGFQLVGLLLTSILTWIVAKLYKLQLGYKQALQINLHAVTLPLVINSLFQLFGANPAVPFFQTIILIIFNLIIFTSLKEKA